MKFTLTLYLLAAGTVLFYSCKKDNDQVNPTCINCIVVEPDTLVGHDTSATDTSRASVTTVVINGPEATIALNGSGDFPGSGFEISIGDSSDVLSNQNFTLTGEPVNMQWMFTDLVRGTYPVRIKQTNYTSGAPYPAFSYTITLPYETINSVVPQPQVSGNEVVYVFNLQVN